MSSIGHGARTRAQRGACRRRRASGPRSRPTRATRRPCGAPPAATRSAPTTPTTPCSGRSRSSSLKAPTRRPAGTDPLDPDRRQARGAGGPARPRADPQRPGGGDARARPRGLGGADPRRRRRPAGAGRAPGSDRPQPRGAADAEAAGAARADPARRGLLLRGDRRDHRLQPDQNQPLPGRGPGALPPAPRAQRRRQPLRGDAAAALRLLRRRGGRPRRRRRCASTCAPAPAAGRPCAPTGRRPAPRRRWRRRCRSAARCSSAPTTRFAGLAARFGGGGGDADSALSAGRGVRAAPAAPGWRRWPRSRRSASAPPAAPPPASRPASSRRRWSIGRQHRAGRRCSSARIDPVVATESERRERGRVRTGAGTRAPDPEPRRPSTSPTPATETAPTPAPEPQAAPPNTRPPPERRSRPATNSDERLRRAGRRQPGGGVRAVRRTRGAILAVLWRCVAVDRLRRRRRGGRDQAAQLARSTSGSGRRRRLARRQRLPRSTGIGLPVRRSASVISGPSTACATPPAALRSASSSCPGDTSRFESIHVPCRSPGLYTVDLWLEGPSGERGPAASGDRCASTTPPGPGAAAAPAGLDRAATHADGRADRSTQRDRCRSPASAATRSRSTAAPAATLRRPGPLHAWRRPTSHGGIDDDTISLGVLPEGVQRRPRRRRLGLGDAVARRPQRDRAGRRDPSRGDA